MNYICLHLHHIPNHSRSIYAELPDFVQLCLREPLRKAFKNKKDLSRSIMSVRKTCADWQKGFKPSENPVLKGKKDPDAGFKITVSALLHHHHAHKFQMVPAAQQLHNNMTNMLLMAQQQQQQHQYQRPMYELEGVVKSRSAAAAAGGPIMMVMMQQCDVSSAVAPASMMLLRYS